LTLSRGAVCSASGWRPGPALHPRPPSPRKEPERDLFAATR
jgi:hypothetical protein